ncbi:MAG: DUF1937 family protein [Candidatus Peribacteraceae bacterium]|nr:DUF1937 family protein [Candidatus Peribacteraceae bacterium]
MIYLASPYTHEYPKIMQMRYDFVLDITAYLIQKGYVIFSPIVHCHVIALRHGLPKDYEFWKKYNESAISSCYGFAITAIDGWEQSKGVRNEYNFAVAEGKTVGMITPLLLGGYEIKQKLSTNPFI